MKIVHGLAIGMLLLAALAGCGMPVGTGDTGTTEIPVQELPTGEPLATAAPEPTAAEEPAEEPLPTEAEAEQAAQATDTPVPSPTPELPTNTPVEAIATLVAVEFGTFPEITDASGNTVSWNTVVSTESIPNAGFFIKNAPDGVQLLSLDCKIVFDGKVVYQRQAPAEDLSLFGLDFQQNSYNFAGANFVWPDFDGDGTSEPIVSGDYTIVLNGETNAGAAVQQSIPFTIDLQAGATPATGEQATPTPVQ